MKNKTENIVFYNFNCGLLIRLFSAFFLFSYNSLNSPKRINEKRLINAVYIYTYVYETLEFIENFIRNIKKINKWINKQTKNALKKIKWCRYLKNNVVLLKYEVYAQSIEMWNRCNLCEYVIITYFLFHFFSLSIG